MALSDRLDEGKIEQLRAWGAGLHADGNHDLRATGKAILLLIEEIERLHVDLWSAKTQEQSGQPQAMRTMESKQVRTGRWGRD
jgi:hypothetical protein